MPQATARVVVCVRKTLGLEFEAEDYDHARDYIYEVMNREDPENQVDVVDHEIFDIDVEIEDLDVEQPPVAPVMPKRITTKRP